MWEVEIEVIKVSGEKLENVLKFALEKLKKIG